jgi:hypothetical protein
MYELSLIKEFIVNKDSYRKYRNYVGNDDIIDDLKPILYAVDEWYAENTDMPAIEDIANLVFSKPVKDKDYLRQTLTRLDSVNGTETVSKLLQGFKLDKALLDISSAAFEAQRGYKPVSDVLALVGKLEEPVGKPIVYVTDDIHEILNDVVKTPGLRWRLNSLNKSLGSLRKGDFGFVFARPETGKTTFLASEVTHMASQLTPSDGPILWFNNEEQGKKVKLRCYQACLGATKTQILAHPDRAKLRYEEITGCKIKIYDSAATHRREVERICREENPSLAIFDQIDKVKGFSSDREDLVMGAIYGWSRELAKTYCPVIGVCQADGTADGERWLYMGHVANAKTAKQAEADFILGIGKSN